MTEPPNDQPMTAQTDDSTTREVDEQSKAILDEIEAETPDNSVHRAYAESQLGRTRVLDLNAIAHEEGLNPEEQPTEVAKAVIVAQSDHFRALGETGVLRDHLDMFEIELAEDAPEAEHLSE